MSKNRRSADVRNCWSSHIFSYAAYIAGVLIFNLCVVNALNTSGRVPRGNASKKSAEDKSRRQLLVHVSGCFGLAIGLSAWEDFESTHVRPKPYIREIFAREHDELNIWGSATRGMGQRSMYSNEMYTYNDVMLKHRQQTVPRWKELQSDQIGIEERRKIITEAARDIYKAIDELYLAANSASDYDWENVIKILRSSTLQENLTDACSALRYSMVSPDAREEIGFDWGSCAWRHCGAQADAQEAISELLKDVGMLEPFECLFVLDIVYRSLCDILAVVPLSLHPTEFQSVSERKPFYSPKADDASGEQESYADMDYEGALSFLRNSLEEDDD